MIQREQQERRRFEVDRRVSHDESMGEAISRVAEAGQHLVLDRLDLLKVEAKAAVDEKVTAATETGKAVGMVAVAAIILRGGWVALMVGLGFFLAPRIGVAGALAIIGGFHVLVALGLLAVAASKQKKAKRAAAGELRQGAEAGYQQPVAART